MNLIGCRILKERAATQVGNDNGEVYKENINYIQQTLTIMLTTECSF